MPTVERAVEVLRRAGWHVVPRASADDVELTPLVRSRYASLDPDHAEFLRRVKSCIDHNRLAWMLCEDDYNGRSSWPIRWNEWELHATEITVGHRDHAERAEAFWHSHIPLAGSLRTEYGYVVLRAQPDDERGVFFGRDPEGARLERVGDGFADLLDALVKKLENSDAPEWMSRFF